MNKKLNKYKVGDKVVVSKLFKTKTYGYMEECDPIICDIKNFNLTSTGPSYNLYHKDIDFKICYWEEDIDYRLNVNEHKNKKHKK